MLNSVAPLTHSWMVPLISHVPFFPWSLATPKKPRSYSCQKVFVSPWFYCLDCGVPYLEGKCWKSMKGKSPHVPNLPISQPLWIQHHKGKSKKWSFPPQIFQLEQKEFLNPQTCPARKQLHTVPKPLTVAWQYTHGIDESLAWLCLQVSYNWLLDFTGQSWLLHRSHHPGLWRALPHACPAAPFLFIFMSYSSPFSFVIDDFPASLFSQGN